MGKVNRTLPVAVLVALGGLIFFLRLHTYDEPLERDVTTYAVVAHEILSGKALYNDVWDHKPPAVHLTYAAAELTAGYGRDAIFLLSVAAAIATMVACYFAGKACGGGALGGLVAAALWTFASGDLALEGNQPNTEVFLNAFLTAGFAVLLHAPAEGLGWRRAMCAGLLFAIASLYKQIVVAQIALLLVLWLASRQAGVRKGAILDLVLIGAIGAVAWALMFGYFAARGDVGAFIEAVFTYNRWYSGGVWGNLSQAAHWPPVSADVLDVLIPMATLSLAGVVAGLGLGARRHWVLLLTFVVATHFAVVLPGRFFPHYYQLWLPPLAIGASWTVALMKQALPASLRALSYVTAAVTCAVLLLLEIPYYRLPAEAWSVKKYGTIFIEADRLAAKLDRLLPAGATLYEWGNEPGFYFNTRREPASGLVFAYPMQAGPLAMKLSARVLKDLHHSMPELIISSNAAFSYTRGHPVVRWLGDNYRPRWRTNSFVVMARKGGAFDYGPPLAIN